MGRDALNLLEGGANFMARLNGTLYITGMEWKPGRTCAQYIVYCTLCDSEFPFDKSRGGATCPTCGAQRNIGMMRAHWRAIPYENMIGRYAMAKDNIIKLIMNRLLRQREISKMLSGNTKPENHIKKELVDAEIKRLERVLKPLKGGKNVRRKRGTPEKQAV